MLTYELLDTIRVNRERLKSQEYFLEQLKTSAEGLLSQEQLQELVSGYRESLVRQELLLQEMLTLKLPNLWLPSDHDEARTWAPPALKLRKVEQATGAPNVLVRLKRTWLRPLYVNHLKRITIVRWLTIRLWRGLYPIYTNTFLINLGSRASKRWRPLLKLCDYVKTSHLSTAKVYDAVRFDTVAPKVFPVADQAFLAPPHDHYVFPPVYVAELGEALIYGGTNLVFTQDAVIYHGLYDFERDYTSEELHGRHVIDAKKKRMRLVRNDAVPEHMPVAASFLDACALNYAHWLTEVLPRIAAFCFVEQHADIPIIIDDGLHSNIMQSLALVVGDDREIVALPLGRAISVDALYVTSVTGYVPFERRNAKLDEHSHGLFSSLAFDQLRKQLLPFCVKFPIQDCTKKIYLRRKFGARKITNSTEIEQILSGEGYVIVEPERLTFLQQVRLFQAADEVIAPTGAALANAIFCRPGTRVGVLMGKHEQMIYRYWLDMLAPLGIRVSYVLGSLADNLEVGIHADFHVDAEHLHELLSDWRSA